MAETLMDMLQGQQQSDTDDQATKIPLSADGKPNLVMRPVPAQQQQPNIAALPVSSRQAPQLSPVSPTLDLTTPSPSRHQISGVPVQRPNIAAPVPGTQHVDPTSGEYKETPYTHAERLNPMLGVFAHSENIGNPALRTLSRIASGVASIGQNIVYGMQPELAKQREEQLSAEDNEAKNVQEMRIKDAAAKEKLGEESLVTDSQGNVVGYKQGGQIKSIETAPPELQQIAQASRPKGGYSIKDVNVIGPDGKPQAMSVWLNESELSKVSQSPEFQQAPDKMKFLKDKGIMSEMNLGQAAPSAAASRPQYHMVPTGNGMEQLAMMNPADPTHPTMIGQPQKVGTTKLLTFEDPTNPGVAQFAQQDSKTGAITPITSGIPAGMTTPQLAGQEEHKVENFNKDWETPAQQVERSYKMFEDAYNEFKNGNPKTGAADMLLLSQHLGTTFGQVKGSRMNKDLIQEHKDAIGIQDKMERLFNQADFGAGLSQNQRDEFRTLISNMRQLTWQASAQEAARRKVPIDFLPSDVKIKMQDSKGTVREVTGDKVADLVTKGAKVAQ